MIYHIMLFFVKKKSSFIIQKVVRFDSFISFCVEDLVLFCKIYKEYSCHLNLKNEKKLKKIWENFHRLKLLKYKKS